MHRGAIVIGLVATTLICVQNFGFLLGFGWAAIHGVGPSALLAFVPAALILIMLWGGLLLLVHRNYKRPSLLVAGYAGALLLVNEAVLPGTPFDAWRTTRTLESVEVRDIKDELLLSSGGNPIGIRVTSNIVFPQTGAYSIGSSTFAPTEGQDPFALQVGALGSLGGIEPAPARAHGPYYRFEKDVVYKYTINAVPHFLSYDPKTQQPCLRREIAIPPDGSEADFVADLSKRRNVKYETEIHLNADNVDTVIPARYTTTRSYDLEAMYKTISIEGNQVCGT